MFLIGFNGNAVVLFNIVLHSINFNNPFSTFNVHNFMLIQMRVFFHNFMRLKRNKRVLGNMGHLPVCHKISFYTRFIVTCCDFGKVIKLHNFHDLVCWGWLWGRKIRFSCLFSFNFLKSLKLFCKCQPQYIIHMGNKYKS